MQPSLFCRWTKCQGSQIDLCPGYRFLFGIRGGLLTIENTCVLEVMYTRQNIALVPGGFSEMIHCIPHSNTIKMSIKYKVFVHISFQHGYDLVLTFLFHANDQYDNPMVKLQYSTYRWSVVPPGIPLYTNRWWIPVPVSNCTTIVIALGKSIPKTKNVNITLDDIDALRRLFYK